MHVCHEFDDPSNVCPNSLWIGTNKQNHEDKKNKGRQARKVSDSDKEKICELYKSGDYSHSHLGKIYEIHRKTIGRIIKATEPIETDAVAGSKKNFLIIFVRLAFFVIDL